MPTNLGCRADDRERKLPPPPCPLNGHHPAERDRERARARTLLIGSCSNEDARLKRQYRAGERVRGKAARICSCLGGLIAETQEEGGQTKEAYILSKEACLGGLIVETQA